jgi:hypothetical protein
MPIFSYRKKKVEAPHLALPLEILEWIFIEACMTRDGGQTAAALRLVSSDVLEIVSPYRFQSICTTGENSLYLLNCQLAEATEEELSNIRDVFLADNRPEQTAHDSMHHADSSQRTYGHSLWWQPRSSSRIRETHWRLNVVLSSVLESCAPAMRTLTLVLSESQPYEPLSMYVRLGSLEKLSFFHDPDFNHHYLSLQNWTFPALHEARVHCSGGSQNLLQLTRMAFTLASRNSSLTNINIEGFVFGAHGYVYMFSYDHLVV